MLTHSEQIDQLASALADAQADLGTVIKQSQNDAFGSKYADLTKVWEAFQRVGPRHGLSIVQMPGHFDAMSRTMSLSVKLMHNSGQWLGGDMSMPLSRGDAHAYGSACTYARRYSLAALIGICPHDDDGNDASGVQVAFNPAMRSQLGAAPRRGPVVAPRTLAAQSRQAEAAPPDGNGEIVSEVGGAGEVPADPQGLIELRQLTGAAGLDEAAICKHYRVSAMSELSPCDAARVKRALKRKIDELAREAN